LYKLGHCGYLVLLHTGDARYYKRLITQIGEYAVESSYIVTFLADDKPGLVEQLSRAIEQLGGNWQESRLCQLAGKFAGIILVTLPADSASLEDELGALGIAGLKLQVDLAGSITLGDAGKSISLNVVGPDRAGIVREVSAALAQRHINVTEMDSNVSSAPMSAELMFNARITACISDTTDLGDLQESLEQIADQMTLEIDLL